MGERSSGSRQLADGGNAVYEIPIAWMKWEIPVLVSGLELSKHGAAGQPLSAGVPSLSMHHCSSQMPRPGPGWDTRIFTIASSHHFLLVLLAAFGNAGWGSSFPFHYHVPEVFHALKPLPAFAVLMHPSSVLSIYI